METKIYNFGDKAKNVHAEDATDSNMDIDITTIYESIYDIENLVQEYDKELAERDRLKTKMVPRAKLYNMLMVISGAAICLASIVIVLLVRFSFTNGMFDLQRSHTLVRVLIFVVAIGFVTFFFFLIRKKLWKRRLEKVGLFLPIEYD